MYSKENNLCGKKKNYKQEVYESLLTINKPKHQKKDEYKEQNGRTDVHEDKRTIKEGEL